MTTETPTLAPALLTRIEALRDICRHRHVRRLDAFGSATNGDFDPASSDIDFLVDFMPLPLGQTADRYFGMKQELEELFERKVDLVADRAIVNPYFRAEVDATRVRVFDADGEMPTPRLKRRTLTMERRVRCWLWDIQRAATTIAEATDGKTYDEYFDDQIVTLAVERLFTIIGEALNRIASVDESIAQRLDGYPKIIGFRNILAHEYERVENEDVWDIIQNHVPTLIAETEAILAEAG